MGRYREETLWFSRREREVLVAVCAALSNKAIAAEMHISVSTVKGHIRTLLEKLELQDRESLIVWAWQHPTALLRGCVPLADAKRHPRGCPCSNEYCLSMRLAA